MRKKIWHIVFVLFISGCVVTPSMAADCKSKKQALKVERDLKKKRKMLGRLIVECPDDAIVNYKYALSLERFRKYDKALAYYQKAVMLNPYLGKAYVGIGDVSMYQDRLPAFGPRFQKRFTMSLNAHNRRGGSLQFF